MTDSQTGDPVEYAFVESDDGRSTLANIDGEYEFSVSEGYRTISASKDGYYSNTSELYVETEVRHELNFVLSPEMGSEGRLRLVLSWGASPEDLDSYIRTPEIEGNEYTIFYDSEGSADSPPYITLDLDDVDGYGPETITIFELYPGTYHYWVNDYDETGDLPGCGAVVNIFDETGQIYNLTIPSVGEGDYWHVCKINGSNGEITIVNTIQSDAPAFMSGELPRKPR